MLNLNELILSFQFNLNVLTANFVMLMKWNPILFWLNSLSFYLNNYVGVVLDCGLTYQSYLFCFFTTLFFYDAKKGNKLGGLQMMLRLM